MSEWICKNCAQPLKVIWQDEEGYVAEHYETKDCAEPEFTAEDAEILDNDYSGDPNLEASLDATKGDRG